MLIKIFILSIMCLIITGCHDNYFVIDKECDYRWINNSIAKGHLNEDKNNERIDFIIPPNAIDFAQDRNYLVVYQIPQDGSDVRESIKGDYAGEKRDSIDRQFARMDSIKHCYWIIRKKDNVVCGPYTKSGYVEKCRQLGIHFKLVKSAKK